MSPLLRRLGYSLQVNAKTREGARHPDRDGQFRRINATLQTGLSAGEPAISVDTKKKVVGDFKNAGRELRPRGSPERVSPPRLPRSRPAAGKGRPLNGVHDIADDTGWVSVGIDHDTA